MEYVIYISHQGHTCPFRYIERMHSIELSPHDGVDVRDDSVTLMLNIHRNTEIYVGD